MRNLQNKDLFKAARLCEAIGIKKEIEKVCMEASSIEDLTQEKFGYEIIFALLSKCTTEQSEQMIYEFFGDILEIAPEELASKDPFETVDEILKAASLEKWRAFFTSVVKLQKSK